MASFRQTIGGAAVKAAAVAALDRARRDGTTPPAYDAIVSAIALDLAARETRGLLRVVNATGILLHTNLGRAPLAPAALAAIAETAAYTNLEFDLSGGTRGSRYDRVTDALCELSGAESALVVNNTAAALLLIVDTFARGREAIVARSELVEIGGGLRIPEMLARAGATLVEIGTTNRVYLRDVERAVGPNTGLILRMHPSNYRLDGFVETLDLREAASLARRVGVALVEDLGSGAFVDLARYGLPHERTVAEAVADGMTLVTFSGDKLLGGPQSGIIVGTAVAIARLRANPLLRALRIDKSTLAALGATLDAYRSGRVEEIPFYAMLARTVTSLEARARAIASRVPVAQPVALSSATGGGALPLDTLPSAGLALPSTRDLAARLRAARPPIVARVERERVLLDLRTVDPADDEHLAGTLAALA